MDPLRPSRLVRFGVFEFDVETGDLWSRGQRTRLQDQPRLVLGMLLERPGELVSREALRDALWPHDTFVDFDAGVNVVVNKIRHVLHDSAASPRFIETLPKRGYRFIAPVTSAPSPDQIGDQPPESIPGTGLSSRRQGFGFWRVWLSPGPRSPRGIALLAGSALAVLAALSAVVTLSRSAPDATFAEAPEPSPGESVNAVAVAALENRTGDASLDGLGQSVAERIIRVIATVSGVHVRPQPIPMTAPGAGRSAALLPDLPASLLVTGTYYAHQDGLEFQARILDAVSGRVLHGTAPVRGSRSQPEQALQPMEQNVAGAVAIHFDDFFGGLDAVSYRPTLGIYREYRAGLEIFWSDYPRAIRHLDRALQEDPEFLQPLVVKLIALDNLGEPAAAESVLARMEGRWDRFTPAERLWVEHLRARREGRRAQALRLLEDLERLVPTSLFVNSNLVGMSVNANRPRAAVRAYDRRPVSEPTFRHGIGYLREARVLDALHLLGEHERELRQVAMAQQHYPGEVRLLELEARALAALGRVAGVRGVIDRSLSLTPQSGIPHTPGEVMEATVRELRVHGYREESLQLAQRAVAWYNDRSAEAADHRTHRDGLARALYLAEQWPAAGAMFAALASEYPESVDYLGFLGCIAAHTRDAALASAISGELAGARGARDAARGTRAPLPTYWRSRIAALLLERQRSVDLLREALAQGLPYGTDLHSQPDLEVLRDYEPYGELLRASH
jgi:DNA-binding winged helix-turn-helix (wHTH) protein/tetratricopeptide (TPR) repeat protein/TolB-like protein